KLHLTSPFATECYKFFIRENLNAPLELPYHSVGLGGGHKTGHIELSELEGCRAGLASGAAGIFYFLYFSVGRAEKLLAPRLSQKQWHGPAQRLSGPCHLGAGVFSWS